MPYPLAPWTLRGDAVQTVHLVDIARAQAVVPPALQVVPVLPGKTLAIVYVAAYGPGSVLQYNELIVAPALTRYRRSFGFWISHIYVDHPDSVAGGREIWGLPKELAQFEWAPGSQRRIVVQQGDRRLCTVDYGTPRRLWRQPLLLPVHSLLQAQLLWFKGVVHGRLGISPARVDVPLESPFSALHLGRGRLAYHLREMHFVAHGPRVISPTIDQHELGTRVS